MTWVIYRGRYYYKKNGKLVPRAHKVWLETNPGFKEIPKGYVVHHLDCDHSNDDPSNLVIMRKTLHAAHHVKNLPAIDAEEIIVTDIPLLFLPKKRPVVHRCSHRDLWYVMFTGYAHDGEIQRIRMYRDFDDNVLNTKEMANKLADYIDSLRVSHNESLNEKNGVKNVS